MFWSKKTYCDMCHNTVTRKGAYVEIIKFTDFGLIFAGFNLCDTCGLKVKRGIDRVKNENPFCS